MLIQKLVSGLWESSEIK